nr:hypothetical protein Itr_chr07CG07990 [Ipomoea trifida]
MAISSDSNISRSGSEQSVRSHHSEQKEQEVPVVIPPVEELPFEDEPIISSFEGSTSKTPKAITKKALPKDFKKASKKAPAKAQAEPSKKPSKKASKKKRAPTPPIIQVLVAEPVDVLVTHLTNDPAEEFVVEVPVALPTEDVPRLDPIQFEDDDSEHVPLTRLASKAQKHKRRETTTSQPADVVRKGPEPPQKRKRITPVLIGPWKILPTINSGTEGLDDTSSSTWTSFE